MITLTEFQQIDHEVQASVDQILDYIRDNCREHNYVLLLAECEYKSEFENTILNLNPYVIDSFEDKRKENTRIDFLVEFLRIYYSFADQATKVDDNYYRLNLELMIYSHIWEAEPYLKKLYRLAELVSKDSYAWEVQVPEMSKHLFIRNDIKAVIKNKKLTLADIITKSFHTSLRNAFAHSQYSFNNYQKCIDLYTYKGDDSWDIKLISFDDWSKRFVYSFYLNYHLLNSLHLRRLSLTNDFAKDSFLIIHPINKTRFRVNRIWYDTYRDAFGFYPFN